MKGDRGVFSPKSNNSARPESQRVVKLSRQQIQEALRIDLSMISNQSLGERYSMDNRERAPQSEATSPETRNQPKLTGSSSLVHAKPELSSIEYIAREIQL